MISIEIGGADKSSIIEFGSVKKKDALNQATDTLNFNIIYHPGQTYRPAVNAEVIMMDGATKVFGGKIYAVDKEVQDMGKVLYKVKCKDYSYDLDRQRVIEAYEDQTVDDIIDDILTNFTDGSFTAVNVNCTLTITKITFDRITVTEALQRLADVTGYSWYVDYDKDIHFFETNSEAAPFDLTDGGGNHITESLQASDDFSQIRNRVFIKGGEIEGEERAELYDGNGTKIFFKLANKFASLPVVEVDAVAQDVGVDFLDNEDDFDCFWDYNQSYIRFKAGTVPGVGTENVEITGIPLYNLVVQVEDPASITAYGLFEYAKTDKTLKSREEAVAMARAELTAYKNGLIEGRFQTYESGLRSGQIINITSTLLDINEDFLIQSVNYTMITATQGIWTAELATLRTVGIIDFLIGLLKSGDRLIEDKGDVILEKTVFPLETITIDDAVEINTDDYPQAEEIEITEVATVQAIDYPVEFVYGPYTPTGYKRVFILNGSPLA